jgi:1-acyl-sn-glycerol-3-phosphate acyltransferase
MLRTLYFYVTFYPFTLVCSLLTLFLSLFGADCTHRFASFWGKGALLFAGIQIEIEGREHLPSSGPALFMANHTSSFDIPTLYAGLPMQFRWLAKQELFDIPFFGTAMRRVGYIPIDRRDRKKSLQSLKEAAERIRSGTSVVIFPEGTRSDDGKLLPFKRGGFSLALQSGAPIVPVVILGSRNITPKGSLRVTAGKVSIRFLAPISTHNLNSDEQESLSDRVHAAIDAALQESHAAAVA